MSKDRSPCNKDTVYMNICLTLLILLSEIVFLLAVQLDYLRYLRQCILMLLHHLCRGSLVLLCYLGGSGLVLLCRSKLEKTVCQSDPSPWNTQVKLLYGCRIFLLELGILLFKSIHPSAVLIRTAVQGIQLRGKNYFKH